MEIIEGLSQHLLSSMRKGMVDLAVPLIFFFYISAWFNRNALKQVIRRVIPETRFNFSIYILDIFFVLPVMVLLVGFIKSFVEISNIALVSPALWSSQNTALVVLAAVFLGDFIGYWRHRLEHTKLLWPSHVLHHSDTEMTWFTLYRFHPINRFTTTFIDTAILALLGFPEWALLANSITRHYYGLFIHANIPWTYGLLSYVFVSPVMHRWHHAREVQGSGSNFATVFSIFDRAWGTYYVPGTCDASLGVKNQPPPGLAANLIHPIRCWLRGTK